MNRELRLRRDARRDLAPLLRALVGALIACSSLAGCATLPETALALPRPGSVSLAARAWIAPVAIEDPEIGDATERTRLEDALTLSLAYYAVDARYFASVNRLPGRLRPGDFVLRFRFAHYRAQKVTHLGGVILEFLTAGASQRRGWPGAEPATLLSNVSAELRIEDSHGDLLLTVDGERRDSIPSDTGMGQLDRWNAMQSRTALVGYLLETAVRGLQP